MTEDEIHSWIFLAVGMASQIEPCNVNEISMIADGINHAVPTQKELRNSLSWLSTRNLTQKHGNKYKLTIQGQNIIDKAEETTVSKTWNNLEKLLKTVHNTRYI